MYCLIVLPFFLQYLMSAENLISSWSVTSKLALIISSHLWTGKIMDSFQWSGNSSIFKVELSLWIADSNISPPAWTNSAGIWSLPGKLNLFNFATAIQQFQQFQFQPQDDWDQVLMVQMYVPFFVLSGRKEGKRKLACRTLYFYLLNITDIMHIR
jgi:hypothetical protein